MQMRELLAEIDLSPVAIRDKAYELLKRAIIEGKLMPGQRLIETQIAKLLNLSRTPLREAILRLDAEGFVERRPSGGVQVRSLSTEEVRELYLVRSALEGLVARQAAGQLTDEQLSRLGGLVRDLEEADEATPDVNRIARVGEQFHLIILEASGNSVAVELLRLLRDHINRYRYLAIAIPGRGRAASKEHAALLDVLRQRAPEESEQAMRRHVLEAGDFLIRRLAELESASRDKHKEESTSTQVEAS